MSRRSVLCAPLRLLTWVKSDAFLRDTSERPKKVSARWLLSCNLNKRSGLKAAVLWSETSIRDSGTSWIQLLHKALPHIWHMKSVYEVIKHLQRRLVSKPSAAAAAASQACCKFLLQFWLINVKRSPSSPRARQVRPGAAAWGPHANWRTHPLETIKARPFLAVSSASDVVHSNTSSGRQKTVCLSECVCVHLIWNVLKHQIRIRQL